MEDINDILNLLDIDDIIKYYIIKFINLNGFKKNIKKITNTKLNQYLDFIADTNNIILTYDIEFYSQLYRSKTNYNHFHLNKLLYIENESSIKTIRELGGLILIRSKYIKNSIEHNKTTNWYYIGEFIFKFNFPVKDIDLLQAIYADYSDVSDKTRNLMIEIENKIIFYKKYNIEKYIDKNYNILENLDAIYNDIYNLSNDIDFKIYIINNNILTYLLDKSNYNNNNIDKLRSYLNKLYKILYNIKYYNYRKLFNKKSNMSVTPSIKNLIEELNLLYINDINVKNNIIKYDDLNIFINIFNNSKNIGKEYNDIDAIINTCYLNNITIPSSYKYFDISFYNQISRFGCNSAKLELTYKCILSKFDKYDLNLDNHSSLLNIINLDKAHNPKVDALMTFIIAIYIIKTLLKDFQ